MSPDLLRTAAAKMRERAEAARGGRWVTAPSDLTPQATLVLAEWQHGPRRVATCAGSLPEGNAANAEHIASWHPAVALAVADWLDSHADIHTLRTCDERLVAPCPALAVAVAYLGRSA